MYLGSLNSEKKIVVVEGVATALAPIAHGEPPALNEERANGRPVRVVTVYVEGKMVEVPLVSSNHLTHIFRVLLARDALRRAGITDEELENIKVNYSQLYQTWFNGGVLEQKKSNNSSDWDNGQEQENGDNLDANGDVEEDEPAGTPAAGTKSKSKKKGKNGDKAAQKEKLRVVFPDVKEFADLFLPVKLFGGTIAWLNNLTLESTVGVGHLWPLTQETSTLFGLSQAKLKEKYQLNEALPSAVFLRQVEPMHFSRTDGTVEQAAKKDKDKDDKQDGRSLYNVSYVPAGIKFLHEIVIEAKDAALALSAMRYVTGKLLPENPYVGGLVKRGFGKMEFKYRFPSTYAANGEEKDYEGLYESHLENCKGKIKEKIIALLS
ncbi:hypothetical protein SDD30_15300 [Moorella naiadis]|uniref:hypothetical protein n=1 Tax=Moorella naiadis (nom. illeg.) TaxID=3093670 RepID=UPI003D9C8C2E